MGGTGSNALVTVLGILAILLIGMLFLYTVINIFFPNIMAAMVGNIEQSIYNMTSFQIDINGDGTVGVVSAGKSTTDDSKTYTGDNKVQGWGGSSVDGD